MDVENQNGTTITDFKDFINRHPKLRGEIRKSGSSWQEHYEKWVLLGEDDPYWTQFHDIKDERKQKETEKFRIKYGEYYTQFVKLTDGIDVNVVQKHVEQLNQTIGMVQSLLGQFIKQQSANEPKSQKQVFDLFRD